MDLQAVKNDQISNRKTAESRGEAAGAPGIWAQVCDSMAQRVSAEDHARWIGDLRLIADVNGEVLVAARDRFSYDRVAADHMRALQRQWDQLDPLGRPLKLTCWKTAPADIRGLIDDPWANSAVAAPDNAPDVDAAALSSAGSMTFETLVTGPSNDIAVKLALRIANGGVLPANLVLIYGRQGTGKTHTLRAIQARMQDTGADRKVVYMTAEEFMSAYFEGVKLRDTSALKASIRSCDLVLIDDLQWISGKKKTEEEFFSNVRAVMAAGGLVVLTADEAPGNLKGFSQRMQSELKGAVAVEVGLPDTDMRRDIVRQHAAMIAQTDPLFQLTPEMVEQIVTEVRGPGRELCGALWSLHTETGFGDIAPTPDMLDMIIRRSEGEQIAPTIDIVKRAAMRVFNVSKSDLESPCKAQSVTRPRQIAMYLCRKLTDKSFPQIGHQFGKRDHTTVLYAYRKLDKKLTAGAPELAHDVDLVCETIREIQAERAD